MQDRNGVYNGNSFAWMYEKDFERRERLRELEELQAEEQERIKEIP